MRTLVHLADLHFGDEDPRPRRGALRRRDGRSGRTSSPSAASSRSALAAPSSSPRAASSIAPVPVDLGPRQPRHPALQPLPPLRHAGAALPTLHLPGHGTALRRRPVSPCWASTRRAPTCSRRAASRCARSSSSGCGSSSSRHTCSRSSSCTTPSSAHPDEPRSHDGRPRTRVPRGRRRVPASTSSSPATRTSATATTSASPTTGSTRSILVFQAGTATARSMRGGESNSFNLITTTAATCGSGTVGVAATAHGDELRRCSRPVVVRIFARARPERRRRRGCAATLRTTNRRPRQGSSARVRPSCPSAAMVHVRVADGDAARA